MQSAFTGKGNLLKEEMTKKYFTRNIADTNIFVLHLHPIVPAMPLNDAHFGRFSLFIRVT